MILDTYDTAKNVQWIGLWETIRDTLILDPKIGASCRFSLQSILENIKRQTY